ncbi:MAG: hypothetical protein WBD28_04835 [Candidatus Zixiibacteriota bacterium]
MPESTISYYFNQINELGANSIIGVCDSLSTRYGRINGISIIPFNHYGREAKKVKVTERGHKYIEDLTKYGFYLDLEAENKNLNQGYAFDHDTLVSSRFSEGAIAGRVCKVLDHDSGVVFSGPISGSVYNHSPNLLPTTECSANYIMKIGDKSGDPDAEVARLVISDVKAKRSWVCSVKVSDFDRADAYDTLSISFTQRRGYGFHYELFWTGVKDLWVDKVIVSNQPGRILFSLTEDSVETPLRNYYNSLDTQLYRWYLMDEPAGGSLPAMNHANKLIGSVQPDWWDSSDITSVFTTLTHTRAKSMAGDLYLSEIGAKEFNVDYYPYRPGTDLQTELSLFCAAMDTCSKKADKFEKPFYATIQVHAWDLCPGDSQCLTAINPTPNQIKVEAYLALTYDAKGLAYFWYTTTYYSRDRQGIIRDTTDWRGLGLVEWSPGDGRFVPNEKWYAVQEINRVLDKIGPTLLELKWEGACQSDTVGEPSFSFINSLESTEYDTPYVEVGFFKDTSDFVDTDCFMLVNRRCIEGKSQNVISYIDKLGEYMIIDLYQDDTVLVDYNESLQAIPFTTHLDPGEGKLFKMVPR